MACACDSKRVLPGCKSLLCGTCGMVASSHYKALCDAEADAAKMNDRFLRCRACKTSNWVAMENTRLVKQESVTEAPATDEPRAPAAPDLSF